MWKVDDVKIKRTQAQWIISLLRTLTKKCIFLQTLSNWKFSLGCFLGEPHEILTNIGFKISMLKERQGFRFLHYSRSKSREGGITWSVCKYMNCKQIKHGQDFSETRPKPAFGRQGLDSDRWARIQFSQVHFGAKLDSRGGPTDLLWSKKRHVTNGGSNWPPLVQKMSRH